MGGRWVLGLRGLGRVEASRIGWLLCILVYCLIELCGEQEVRRLKREEPGRVGTSAHWSRNGL